MMNIVFAALSQGLLYAPLALGIFITYKILNTPDLTVDGSFVFGMTTCAVVTIAGFPILALIAGISAGALAGLITGIMQTKCRINPILSGIITMTGLYSVNYLILGSSNRYLQSVTKNATGIMVPVASDTIYKRFASLTGIANSDVNAAGLTLLIIAMLTVALILFFKMRLGIAIRAVGDNEQMVRAASINADAIRIVGTALGNALVGFSGALLCQKQTFADLNYGTGMLVMGLAAVIIGQIFLQNHGISLGILLASVGSVFYHGIIALAYQADMPSYMVKMVSSLIVFCAITFPIVRKKAVMKRQRKALN